jgi:LysM repeat protein
MSDVKKEEGSAAEKVGYAWNDSDLYQGDGFEQMECGYPYQVMRGDTLQSIAQRFGILPRNIIDANELTPPFSVSPGQRLIIPVQIHVVRSGDTLVSIGRTHNIPWQNIAEANNIRAPYTILVGQRLALPGTFCRVSPPAPPPEPPFVREGVLYEVRQGDTLQSIATLFDLMPREIARANGLVPPFRVTPGQLLRIPVSVLLYRIRSGDTVAALSRRFGSTVGLIARFNNLRPPFTIIVNNWLTIVIPRAAFGPGMPIEPGMGEQPGSPGDEWDSTWPDYGSDYGNNYNDDYFYGVNENDPENTGKKG